MSELISGKEALIALANGEMVEVREKDITRDWSDVYKSMMLSAFEGGFWEFRLKPRTVNLNGVEVGQLYSSQWDREKPNKVTLEFKTEEDARHFSKNALNIFNGV